MLAAQRRRPAHVAVIGAMVVCPLTRREQPVARCVHCPNLQGSLEGPEPCVLCGAPARPAVGPRDTRRRGGRLRLVLFQDWPDDD